MELEVEVEVEIHYVDVDDVSTSGINVDGVVGQKSTVARQRPSINISVK